MNKDKLEAPHFALASDSMIYGASRTLVNALRGAAEAGYLAKGIMVSIKGMTQKAYDAWGIREKPSAFDCTGPIVCLKSELKPKSTYTMYVYKYHGGVITDLLGTFIGDDINQIKADFKMAQIEFGMVYITWEELNTEQLKALNDNRNRTNHCAI